MHDRKRPALAVPDAAWHVKQHHADYQRTANAAYAWEAIAVCLSADLELPPWLRRYLLTVASKITKLSRNSVPRKNHVSKAVAAAMGLECRGRKNPFNELLQPGHELLVAMDVYRCHTKNRHYNMAAVFADVASTHAISSGTVRRYWYAHARTVIPPHMFRRSTSQKLADVLR